MTDGTSIEVFPELTVEIREGGSSGPGPCISCSSTTDTGLGFVGDAGWCVEALQRIVPRSDAEEVVLEVAARDHGTTPEQLTEMSCVITLCRNCAHLTGFRVRNLVASEGLVIYPQPGHGSQGS